MLKIPVRCWNRDSDKLVGRLKGGFQAIHELWKVGEINVPSGPVLRSRVLPIEVYSVEPISRHEGHERLDKGPLPRD